MDKKADNIVIIDVRETGAITDFFVICDTDSEKGVKAVSDHIEKTLKEKKIKIVDKEGLSKKTWVLLGTGDVIAHIFNRKTREFYNLEGLWADSPKLTVEDGSADPF